MRQSVSGRGPDITIYNEIWNAIERRPAPVRAEEMVSGVRPGQRIKLIEAKRGPGSKNKSQLYRNAASDDISQSAVYRFALSGNVMITGMRFIETGGLPKGKDEAGPESDLMKIRRKISGHFSVKFDVIAWARTKTLIKRAYLLIYPLC